MSEIKRITHVPGCTTSIGYSGTSHGRMLRRPIDAWFTFCLTSEHAQSTIGEVGRKVDGGEIARQRTNHVQIQGSTSTHAGSGIPRIGQRQSTEKIYIRCILPLQYCWYAFGFVVLDIFFILTLSEIILSKLTSVWKFSPKRRRKFQKLLLSNSIVIIRLPINLVCPTFDARRKFPTEIRNFQMLSNSAQ